MHRVVSFLAAGPKSVRQNRTAGAHDQTWSHVPSHRKDTAGSGRRAPCRTRHRQDTANKVSVRSAPSSILRRCTLRDVAVQARFGALGASVGQTSLGGVCVRAPFRPCSLTRCWPVTRAVRCVVAAKCRTASSC